MAKKTAKKTVKKTVVKETMYLVGAYKDIVPGCSWGVIGLFKTEEEAVNACKDSYYFVMSLEVGLDTGEKIEIVGYYPKRQS